VAAAAEQAHVGQLPEVRGVRQEGGLERASRQAVQPEGGQRRVQLVQRLGVVQLEL